MNNPRYYDESVRLLPGERLFLYTDGVADQWMEEPGKIINDTNIINIIKDNGDLNIALNLVARYVYKQLDTIGANKGRYHNGFGAATSKSESAAKNNVPELLLTLLYNSLKYFRTFSAGPASGVSFPWATKHYVSTLQVRNIFHR